MAESRMSANLTPTLSAVAACAVGGHSPCLSPADTLLPSRGRDTAETCVEGSGYYLGAHRRASSHAFVRRCTTNRIADCLACLLPYRMTTWAPTSSAQIFQKQDH